MDHRDRLIAYSEKKYGFSPKLCVVNLIFPRLQEARDDRWREFAKHLKEIGIQPKKPTATLMSMYAVIDHATKPNSDHSPEDEEPAGKRRKPDTTEAYNNLMLKIFVFMEMVVLNSPSTEIYSDAVFEIVGNLLYNNLDLSQTNQQYQKVNNLMDSCKTEEFSNLVVWFDIFKTQKINGNFTATFSMKDNVFEKLFMITQISTETLKQKNAYDLLFRMPQFEYSLMLTSTSHLKLYMKSVFEEKQKEDDVLFLRSDISSVLTPENHFKLYMKSVLEFQQKTEKEKKENPMTEDPIFEYDPTIWDPFFSLMPSGFDKKLMMEKNYSPESDYLSVTQIKRVEKDVTIFELVKCVNVNFIMIALFLKLAEETVLEIINLTQKLSEHVTDSVVYGYKGLIKGSICRYFKVLIEDKNLLSTTMPWKNVMTIIDCMKQVLYSDENFKQVTDIYKPKVDLVTHQTITDRFKQFAMNWLTTSYTYVSDIKFLTYLQKATKNEGDNSKNKKSVKKFECDMQSFSNDLGYLDSSLRPEENRIDTFINPKGAGRILNYFASK
jgi:hypothetical protein